MSGDLAVRSSRLAHYKQSTSSGYRKPYVSAESSDDVEYKPNIVFRFFRKVFSAIERFFKRLVGIKEPAQEVIKEPINEPIQRPMIMDRETPGYEVPSPPASPQLLSHRENLKICSSMNEQISYLEKSVLPKVNEALPLALQEFNKQSEIGLQCIGVSPGPRQITLEDKGPKVPSSQLSAGLVFTTLTSTPVTIVLSDRELAGKSNDEIKRIIERKVTENKTRFSKQNEIWESFQRNIDFPKGKTSFVVISIPGKIKGQLEDDCKEFCDIALKKKGKIRGIAMGDLTEWDKVRGTNLPRGVVATKSNILGVISEATTKSIEEKDEALVIKLTGHGTSEGKTKVVEDSFGTKKDYFGAKKANLITLEDKIKAVTEEIKKNKNSTLQYVHFDIETCEAHAQMTESLEKAIKDLCSCGVKVSTTFSSDKNLKVNSKRNKESYSYAGSNITDSALINPKMAKTNSATNAYYFSLAFQINPNISYFRALQWADQLSRLDSPTQQNMHGYFFTTDSKGKLIKEQFTKNDKISEDISKPNKVAIA